MICVPTTKWTYLNRGVNFPKLEDEFDALMGEQNWYWVVEWFDNDVWGDWPLRTGLLFREAQDATMFKLKFGI